MRYRVWCSAGLNRTDRMMSLHRLCRGLSAALMAWVWRAMGARVALLCATAGLVIVACGPVDGPSAPTIPAPTTAPTTSAPAAATAAPTQPAIVAPPTVEVAQRPCATIEAGLAEGDRPPDGGERSPEDLDLVYDAESNTIVLREGAPATLAEVARLLDRPEALRELAPGEWLLAANLRVERGAELRVAGPETRRLKLRSDTRDFVWIKAFGGKLTFTDTCVTSWDAASGGVDENATDGRSFVLARDGARLDIRGAELSYLGYDADESYGVAWRLEGTSGEVVDSVFGYNFYGLYSYEASDLVIRASEVHHSLRYGIDPHTRSNRLLIEGNRSHHNGKHGIILAEDCTRSVIRDNIVYANALHGIVLYEGSNDNLVERNISYANGMQGINLNNASDNTIRNNSVYDNGEAGIGVGQRARNNLIASNQVRANRADGITLYSDAARNTLEANVVSENARYGIYVKSERNTIGAGNQVFGNAVGIYLNVARPPEVSREDNRIYGNREADVRAGE